MKLPLIFEMLSDFADTLAIKDKEMPISLAVLGAPGKWIKTHGWPIVQDEDSVVSLEGSKSNNPYR